MMDNRVQLYYPSFITSDKKERLCVLMELTKRLEAIAGFVTPGSVIADVGTDHGYIPIYLAQKGLIKKAYAMDINEGPLERARKNIKSQGVSHVVETILSDGLKNLGNRSIETLIVAGMGGMLINKILEDATSQLPHIPTLILSPHLDVDRVRRTVHELSYCIIEETIVEEDGKFYPILLCQHGHEIYKDDIEYKYGKKLLEGNNPTFKHFLEKQRSAIEVIWNQLLTSDSQGSQKRMEILQIERLEIEEVMRCLLP